MKIALPSILTLVILNSSLNAQQVYQESGGVVIIEAENTTSDYDQWELKTALPHTGTGYIEFTGNSPINGDPKSPLEYAFKINKAGLYHLNLHCARETLSIRNEVRTDVANDAYVRVEGDYKAGPKTLGADGIESHGDHAMLSTLMSDTKFFGGDDNVFSWAFGNRLDLGGEHENKRTAVYDFKAGETYKLVVSGRSQKFKINRFLFRHQSVARLASQDLVNPESVTVSVNNDTGSKTTDGDISGELKKWHKITLNWQGPNTSETATPNPFSDYRLNVTFSHAASGKSYVVPGYYAADGDAANSSADSGNIWRAHFAPDQVGNWTYRASFREGADIAIDASSSAGKSAGFFDGDSGAFHVSASDKSGRDLRGKGRLKYVNKHHLQFEETSEYFLKAGVDAPENLLAYDDIDDTPNSLRKNKKLRKSWSPHAGDYDAADASSYTWGNSQGTELLGAIKYLSDRGLNAFSCLTFNIDGDDDNVFPHRLLGSVADYEAIPDDQRWANSSGGVHHDRFDVSKTAQWENIFAYGDKKGMYIHFKTQETENDQKMDGGDLGRERKLYYRELIARFSHHLALNWNLGEENTNTEAQRKAFAQYFADNDPYRHNIVLHTYPNNHSAKSPIDQYTTYPALLGNQSELTGVSLQTNLKNFGHVFSDTLTWVSNSAKAGKPWVVAVDEPGDPSSALRPEGDEGNTWEDGRKNALWGNVMAGGAGTEYYFGYAFPHSDLTCQDFRSRNGFWDYCRHQLEFFHKNTIPFQNMSNSSHSSNPDSWCLSQEGSIYLVYLKNGGRTYLDLIDQSGNFEVKWFDPRNGGALQDSNVTTVEGGSVIGLGKAPSEPKKDWVILVRSAASKN